jgi:hypothetical protein
MNTKHVENPEERKKLKRTARKKAAPKAKRPDTEARGSNKKKIRKLAKGQLKAHPFHGGSDIVAPHKPAPYVSGKQILNTE